MALLHPSAAGRHHAVARCAAAKFVGRTTSSGNGIPTQEDDSDLGWIHFSLFQRFEFQAAFLHFADIPGAGPVDRGSPRVGVARGVDDHGGIGRGFVHRWIGACADDPGNGK